jgi:hypothetical protein
MGVKRASRQGPNGHTLPDLLRKARAQPGVKDLMRVYRAWQTAEGTVRPFRQVLHGTPVISASNSSLPTSW